MDVSEEYKVILEKVQAMDSWCRDLLEVSGSQPCLERNARRIQASVEMLKLDFPEISDLE